MSSRQRDGLTPHIAQRLARDIAATKAPINRARHLPGYMYTSEDVYALEKEKIFMRDWLCVARVEEIENPGDYMTFRLMNEPFIVARAADGSINAYRNSCAHRGLVVAKGVRQRQRVHLRVPRLVLRPRGPAGRRPVHG